MQRVNNVMLTFQILLVSSSKYADRWVVPGGGIEPLEEPRLAAGREALEEAGAKGHIGRMLGVFEVLKYTVKPVVGGHLKRRPKIGFPDRLLLNAGQRIAECSKGTILQYFRPSLSYNLPLRPLLCLFISGRLRQGLLYRFC